MSVKTDELSAREWQDAQEYAANAIRLCLRKDYEGLADRPVTVALSYPTDIMKDYPTEESLDSRRAVVLLAREYAGAILKLAGHKGKINPAGHNGHPWTDHRSVDIHTTAEVAKRAQAMLESAMLPSIEDALGLQGLAENPLLERDTHLAANEQRTPELQ